MTVFNNEGLAMKYVLILILGFALIACGSGPVDMKDLRVSGDMVFLKTKDVAFTGTAVIYDEKSKSKIEEIEYVDGVAHGNSKGWYLNGNKSYVATYEEGKRISNQSWDKDGSPQDEE